MQNNKEETTVIYRWNPWIGCHKISQGCKNCSSAQFFEANYYQTIQLDLGNFDLPLQRKSNGQLYIPKNSKVAVQFNGDFFIQEMDFFRPFLWNIIKIRSDCQFIISTKRPERIKENLPKDWHNGWDNVVIGCTAETQELIDKRVPIYLDVPLKKYQILAQPLIEQLDFSKYLSSIDAIIAEGEFVVDELFIPLTRPCNYKWVKSLHDQCKKTNTDFIFTLSGCRWINENGQEETVSPYGWDMRERIKEYNFNIGQLFDFNTNQYELAFINKEENNQGQE